MQFCEKGVLVVPVVIIRSRRKHRPVSVNSSTIKESSILRSKKNQLLEELIILRSVLQSEGVFARDPLSHLANARFPERCREIHVDGLERRSDHRNRLVEATKKRSFNVNANQIGAKLSRYPDQLGTSSWTICRLSSANAHRVISKLSQIL
jgi:hypothetical protein